MKKINVFVLGEDGVIDYDDYYIFEEDLYSVLEKYFEEDYKIVIKEQELNSIDTLSIRFACENNCTLDRCIVDWKLYGKKAAYENIKNIIWGGEGIDLLIIFSKKNKQNSFIEKVINEFKSILTFDSFSNLNNLYIFEK